MLGTNPIDSIGFSPATPRSRFILYLSIIFFTCACLWISLSYEFFHPLDEIQHVDFVVKLVEETVPDPSSPLENEITRFAWQRIDSFRYFYFDTVQEVNYESQYDGNISYQAYQAPLYHKLMACVWRLCSGLDLKLESRLLLLRGCTTLMVVLGRLLLAVALLRIDPRILAIALPYLFFWIPVDLLRISNDGLNHLLGCLTFLLIVESQRRGSTGWSARFAGASLFLATLTKQNSVFFLMPSAFIVMWFDGNRSLRAYL